MSKILDKIKSPKDLQNVKNLNELCKEIRLKLLEIVSKNGGHLAPNLGVVELTIAIHKVFNDKSDAIIWDVGHQSYVHKMLTGRLNKMNTIRQENGISGFTNRFESDYDKFTSGHSSTSISSALGLSEAKHLQKDNGNVVAVIGDGALTGGLAYEGLNNAGRLKRNFIIIINDNKMSISKNVGSIPRYLNVMRTRPYYVKTKKIVRHILDKLPKWFGKYLIHALYKSKSTLKNIVYNSTIFEDMGFYYYGPLDGHNIDQLIENFKLCKNLNRPAIIHVITKKGKGYEFAEKDPKSFHGTSSFDLSTGIATKKSDNFSSVFGKELCDIAKTNNKICAITAAMTTGTGLKEFAKEYKSRFFDVGIAEEHATTFAGGLSAGGMIPIFAVYSSFLQRSFDQIIHDVSLQRFKVIFAIDRAGFVGDDGETHQGIFDVSFLNSIPNIDVFSPSFYDELKFMLNNSIYKLATASAIRYPKGSELFKPKDWHYNGENFNLYGDADSNFLIITYGRIFSNTYQTMELLKSKGIKICILKLNQIKPIDEKAIQYALRFQKIFFFEESLRSGGVAEKFASLLLQNSYHGEYFNISINDIFVKHANIDSQLRQFNLDIDGMYNFITKKT